MMRPLRTARTSVLAAGLLLLAAGVSLAQPMFAPMNPQYRQARRAAVGGPVTDAEGHTLGFIPPPFKAPMQAGAAQLREQLGAPATYDLRDTANKVPPVRNQGSCGSCWAFATYGSLETYLRPTDTTDLSENNLRSNHGWDWGSCSGGNHYISTAYLSRWGGPVLESEDPYTPTEPTNPSSPTLPPYRHVQQVLFLPGDAGAIKNAIMSYGAAYVSYYSASTYYYNGPGGMAYYYPFASGSNHAVCIIGWDDNYASTNFKPGTQPSGNGAWLVRNSWGSSWGNSGYFWCSYYDAQMAKSYAAVFNNAEPTTNYDNNYQYDPLGNISALNRPYAANVFTADGKEVLRAVGFYTEAPGASYTVRIYKNPSPLPIGDRTVVSTVSGSTTYAGYYTVPLTTPVALSSGDTFTVSVYITGGGTYPSALEYAYAGVTSGATASPGQSYYSANGTSWTDLTSFDSTANFCIKAFTDDNKAPSAPTSVTISPSGPFTTDDLTAEATGSTDPDPGDTVSYEYQWCRSTTGGASWGAWGNDGNVLASAQTARDEMWKARARATDGTDYSDYTESDPVTIGNSAPTAPTSCSISPTSPKTADDLTGTATGSTDADPGDTVTYEFQWAVSTGGGPWSDWGDDGNPLPSARTTKGEQWKARARATDGTASSGWTESLPVTIGNTAPTAPTSCSISPTSPEPDDDLTASASGATDADPGDTVSYEYQWCSSTGGPWSEWGYDGATLDSANTSAGEQWKARARATDGTDSSGWTESSPVTIGYPAPTVTGIDPSSGPNTTAIDVTIAGTGFRSGASAKLQKTGETDIVGTSLTVVGDTQITCTFDITGAATGLWDVTVTNTDAKSGTLPDGFEVVSGDVSPPDITGWSIAVSHGGGVGELLTPISDGYIEPRTCAVTCLVVYFDEPLDPATFTPSCVSIVGVTNGDQSSLVNSVALQGDGSVARITLTGTLPQPDRYTVTISTAVEDPAGNPLGGDRDIQFNVLHGDANGNGAVDIGDMLAVRAHSGIGVDATVCRYDVNCNGSIDTGDMLAVRAHYGASLP